MLLRLGTRIAPSNISCSAWSYMSNESKWRPPAGTWKELTQHYSPEDKANKGLVWAGEHQSRPDRGPPDILRVMHLKKKPEG